MATHYFASHHGGIEIVAEQLFHHLTAAGHEVVWIAGDNTPPPEACGKSHANPIRVLNSVERKIGLPFPIPTIASLGTIRAEVYKADLVLLHDCLYLSNVAAFREARLKGVPTIVVQHIGYVPYANFALNAMMRIANTTMTRPILRRASQVVFISERTQQFFSDLTFRRPPKLIFNGVDANLYRPVRSTGERAELRKCFDLPKSHPVILFVGRFVEKKGLAILQRMAAMKPDYVWAFAGWGPLDPRAWNAANVKVFLGLRGESIAALYRACDILVLPSVGEGFPLVVQEALASGLPVVCGSETISADPEVAHLASGVAIHLADPEHTATACVDAVERMLNCEVEGNQSSLRREFALHRYSWQQSAERYLQLAKELVFQHSDQLAASPGNSQ